MVKLYIAGKIEKNDWRGRFVPNLRNAVWSHELGEKGYVALDKSVLLTDRVSYVGPFFVSCDHGCSHGNEEHGAMGGCFLCADGAGPDSGGVTEVPHHHSGCDCHGCEGPELFDPKSRGHVVRKCFEQVASADVMIALIADDAHGTLVEVGYALALGKPVYVTRSIDCGLPERPSMMSAQRERGAWFPFHAPGTSRQCCVRHTVEFITKPPPPPPRSEESRCESPVELAFLRSMRRHKELARFAPNVTVMDGRYRIDFADPTNLIGIEIDGHQFHSDKETFAKDRVRQRELEKSGWRIVRYSGQEVHRDADSCVADLRAWLAATA